MNFDEKTRRLQASENNFVANKQLTEVYGNYIYLGIYDKAENYTEVNNLTRSSILEKINEERKLEQEKNNKKSEVI